MGHIKIIIRYWLLVFREATERGFKLATGGWPKFIVTLLVLVVVWVGLFFGFFKGPPATDIARNILNGLMALAVVFAILVAIGVIVIPPQFDKQIREEKAAAIAKSNDLSEQMDSRMTTEKRFERLNQLLAKGNDYFHDTRARNHPHWRETVWSWRGEVLLAFSGDRKIAEVFGGWQSRSQMKQDGRQNPSQHYLDQLKSGLDCLSGERDQIAREISAAAIGDASTTGVGPIA